MSYRGGRGKSGGGFSVTTDWDGSRTFDDSRRGGGGPRKSNSRGRGRGSYSYNKNYRGRGGGPNPRSRFEDEDGDVSMSDDRPAPSSSRYNPYGSRRPYTRGSFRSAAMDRQGSADVSQRLGVFSNSRTNTRKKSGRDYHRDNNRYEVSDSGWYRVTIPYGANVEKNDLLKLMNSHVDVPFRPLQFRTEQKNATFYLNDDNSALAVKNLYKKFSLPSGFKIIVIVKPCNPPPPVMNDETKEKLKISMSERYDVAARSLNLSALCKDPKLSAEGIHVALNRYNVMTAVIKIIEQNIPELTGLDLSGNKLMALDTLGTLVDKTPHLAHLNLGNNIVKNADELAKIKNWKLTELVLEGNNMCDHYKEKSTYISAIRKHFPKVLKLDGLDLPPPITFDLELSTELPTQKDNYFKNDVVKELVVKFVKQYYDVFDSGSREALVAAYHDEAAFSMTFGYNKMIVGKQSPWPDLTTQSRNLLRVHGEEKRLGLMKRGKLEIISHFKSHFPRTTHDRNSFHVDVNIATNELLMFSVSGIFKEAGPGKSERGTIRTFQRVFSTVSHGGGVVITNDMMTVTNASPQQVQGAFKTPAPTPSSSPVLGVAPVQDPMTPDPTKLAMVQQFSVQSGMNLDWSTKCLEENEWNYEKAAKVFTEFHKEGKIPPDAFK